MEVEGGWRRWRGLVGVLTAQGVAWTGTRLSAIALPSFVLTSTDSAALTGVVVFAEMAPYVVMQVLAGPVIDQLGPRRISIVGDIASMLAIAAIPVLFALDILTIPLLLVIVGVVGALRGPSDAAKSVFVPAMTALARVPLERGTGLLGPSTVCPPRSGRPWPVLWSPPSAARTRWGYRPALRAGRLSAQPHKYEVVL